MPEAIDVDSIGPVDVGVILFDRNQFNGDVAPALVEMQESGVVRIIDLAFIRKESDGSVTIVEVEDADVSDAFASVNDSPMDLLNDEDLDGIAQGLAPDSSALVIVWENTWAARFAAAVRGSNGKLIADVRIPRDVVLKAVAALDEG